MQKSSTSQNIGIICSTIGKTRLLSDSWFCGYYHFIRFWRVFPYLFFLFLVELTLNTVLEQLDPNDKLAKKIRVAVGAAKTKSFFDLPYIKYEDTYDAISTSHIDIASFCRAEVFYSKKKTDENTLAESCRHEDSIVFFKPFRLNQKIKFIVTSATADEKIYKCCLGAKRVTFYQCKNAEIVGTINQYDELPMSRSFIDKNPGVLEELIKFSGFDDVITFKKYSKGKYYYGKTTGINALTSHNLTIPGTPHQPEWLYKLFAYTIGWKNPLDENREAKMRYQLVNQDGFIFFLLVFEQLIILRKYHRITF